MQNSSPSSGSQAECHCAATCLQNDLYDALFYLRIVVAIMMGVLFGALGAQGLMSFLT